MRLIVTFALLISTVVSGSIVNESHNRLRRQIYGKQPTLPPLDGYTRQGVPVVKSSYADSKHVDTKFDGRKELDHYRDFVNDPWVNTKDLGQITQTRPRPELRSGRGSVDDEIWTRRRQQQRKQQYQQQPQQPSQQQPQQQAQRVHSIVPTSSTWSRVPEPWHHRSSENRRVSARLVDQGSGTEQIVRDQHQRGSPSATRERVSYQPTRTYQTDSRTWQPQPELRSLDSTTDQNQVQEANRVRASSSDSYVTRRKVGNSGSTGSESTSTFSGGRAYHEDSQAYGRSSRTRESWTIRPTTRYAQHAQHYPIMNDRETAEKAARNGPNVMV